MLFTSDNWAGVHPNIMQAMLDANQGSAPAYAADDWSKSVDDVFCDLFGSDIKSYFVATGTAANSIALASMMPPWGAVFAHNDAHIHVDECGATEFVSGGAKIIPLSSPHGKLTPEAINEGMKFFTPQHNHRVVPHVLSLTQATEAGTIYTADEIGSLCEMAKKYNLSVHMDGARFSNACADRRSSVKEMTVDAGVDILTFGGTKNGCLAAEAIILLNTELTDQIGWRQRRAGHVFSKNRFVAAQWSAFLKDDLWLELAGHANNMASQLSKALITQPGCKVVHPTEINEVFVTMPDKLAEYLRESGATFYDWVQPNDPYLGKLRRLVTSYETEQKDIDDFVRILSKFKSI